MLIHVTGRPDILDPDAGHAGLEGVMPGVLRHGGQLRVPSAGAMAGLERQAAPVPDPVPDPMLDDAA